MGRIVPDILSLPQHLETLEQQPVRYRPVACPHCGLAKPWGHGCYQRKADRRPGPDGSLNPIAIPRYRCSVVGRISNAHPPNGVPGSGG
jgi:hypothetical protein